MTTVNNDKSGEYWQTVAANDVDDKVWVVPDGETWILQEVDGSGAGQNAIVCILWDGDILFCTISSLIMSFDRKLVGDGIKELKIVLDNGTDSSQPMGIRFNARKA